MKYRIGTLIVGNSKDKKSTAFGLITEIYHDTKKYKIAIQRHMNGSKTEWDQGTWNEDVLIRWEEEYGYTFVK
jgi:hypothetical protein|tara:strand:- start:1141 stop:1359 length:219 start_codon:yes stop_codon:yes gene_type:complete